MPDGKNTPEPFRPEPALLRQHIDSGHDLIPLHKFNYVDGQGRKRGKSPKDNDWSRRVYPSFDPVAHMGGGGNVGVRLRDDELVLDVDPRNFADGDDPLKRLCEDTGLDLDKCPLIETGSGGWHYYMRKPDDAVLRDSLKEYQGLEFKSRGRQVVSAGSLHPDTGRQYKWDALSPPLREAPQAPRTLIDLARRPPVPPSGQEDSPYTADQVAAMLDGLRPEDFRDQDNWLQLMMSAHYASNGEAREEFKEWSTRDPKYATHGGVIGRRWDSLHKNRPGAVTHKTLEKFLRDAGKEALIPRDSAADDFDKEEETDLNGRLLAAHEQLGPLERMNQQYWAVTEGGKFRIWQEAEDPAYKPPRKYWTQMARYDFDQTLANRRVQKGERTVPISQAWMEWPKRRSAPKGAIFDPERRHPDRLNLWTGWQFEPAKGDWSRVRALIEEVVCSGDATSIEYVLNWVADMFQQPWLAAEVAICMRGDYGVGKGTFGRMLVKMAGRHGLQITSPKHLTGQFNSHLRDLVVLFADEAVKPTDSEAESQLKGLVTEPILMFEAKGKDAVSGPNRMHVVMASNEEWMTSAGLRDRRFFMTQASDAHMGDKPFWDKLHEQLANGGHEAFLFDMLRRDVNGWRPRIGFPVTALAAETRVRSLPPIGRWWMKCLEDGAPPGEPVPFAGNTRDPATGTDWWRGPVRLFKHDVMQSYEAWCRSGRTNASDFSRDLDRVFFGEWRRFCPGLLPK